VLVLLKTTESLRSCLAMLRTVKAKLNLRTKTLKKRELCEISLLDVFFEEEQGLLLHY